MDFGVLNCTALGSQSKAPVPSPAWEILTPLAGAGTEHLPPALRPPGMGVCPHFLLPSQKNLQQVSVLSAQKMFACHLSTGRNKSLPTTCTDEIQGSLMNNHRTHPSPAGDPPWRKEGGGRQSSTQTKFLKTNFTF